MAGNTPRKRPTVRNANRSHQSPSSAPARKRSSGASARAASPGSQNISAGLWSESSQNGTSKRSSGTSSGSSVFAKVGAFLLAVVRAVLSGLGFIVRSLAHWFAWLFRTSRKAFVAVVVVLVLLVGFGVDAVVTDGHIYQGVTVGGVSVGGMTEQEAETALAEAYGPRMQQSSVAIYSDDEAMQKGDAGSDGLNSADEEISTDQARSQTTSWVTDSDILQARFDAQRAAQDALSVGRTDGGLWARIAAYFFGYDVQPHAQYNSSAIESLAEDIDKTIGDPRQDCDISVTGSQASVVQGHDGWMVDRDDLCDQLDHAFLDSDATEGFVAEAVYSPMRINDDEAQSACDHVNAVIASGVEFSYGQSVWQPDGATLGSWIETEVVQDDTGSWHLKPYFDQGLAKSSLLTNLKAASTDGNGITVTFENTDEGMMVHTGTEGTIPQSGEAIDALNDRAFESDETSGIITIDVGSAEIPEMLDFQEALDDGLITEIATYTTEYTSGAAARNHNIHLAADLLNNSIATANGGTWSFQDIAGECNEDQGFQAAGTIVDGETVDSIGGGICQMATTVFNAVYVAGYPIPVRHNHSLYIASYPAGRDAAVSWPDLDLQWENDSSSDVLLRTSYTDTSVTVTLYGIDPEYVVTSETGDWEQGEAYDTIIQTDDTLASGSTYIKQNGSDGRSITVVRTVDDKNGQRLHQDSFTSTYDPKDEIIVKGSA